MASTKRVSGNYDIYANTTTIHGNVVFTGNTIYNQANNSFVTDNIIVLNQGEAGSGVTRGNAGIQIDRGLSANAWWTFNENGDYWSGTINGALLNIRAASPVNNDDVVTKGYLTGFGGTASGSNNNIQYNTAGTLTGSNNFNYFASNGNVQLGNTLIANNAIITTFSNNDLSLDANGTGKIFIKETIKLQWQVGATPTDVASTIQLLANAPGQGSTGLYVVNSSGSDELISKRKATWIGLVMS